MFSWDVDFWKKLGVSPFHHKLQREEILYVPTGYVLAERTSEATMIYGARKSFIFAHDTALTAYTQCLSLMQGDGKSLEKMELVANTLKAALEQK